MKRKLFMLCLAGMLLYTNPAFATPFPDKTDNVVQDQDNYLKAENTAQFIESIKDLPGEYKVVVVESTSPEASSADLYAQTLYDNFNLPDNAIMVVLDYNTEELGVYAGPEFQEKGATLEMLHDKISSYYVPFRNQKQYLNGIQTFLQEVHRELERVQNKPAQPEQADAAKETEEVKAKSFLGEIPWWIYGIGAVFAILSIALVYAMIRRRSIFSQVDDVEDWKDELVEKIHVIEVEKPLRRSSGMTEVRYHHIADKKENLLRIKIPDVEMMILDAEEACDRFRFSLAIGMLEEAREALTQIEQELAELKEDTTKVAVTKQENKAAIPEIGKMVEQVERRLSDMRLDYGLSFHELKSTLDEVEGMRTLVKKSRAAGDDVHAYETTMKAQKMLEGIVQALEQVPGMVDRVKKEMPREFKQLEEGIEQARRDGFDISLDGLDNAMLQAKQLMNAAGNGLEEGNLEIVKTHVKAFEVLIEATYQGLEEAVLAKQQAAAAAVAAAEASRPRELVETVEAARLRELVAAEEEARVRELAESEEARLRALVEAEEAARLRELAEAEEAARLRELAEAEEAARLRELAEAEEAAHLRELAEAEEAARLRNLAEAEEAARLRELAEAEELARLREQAKAEEARRLLEQDTISQAEREGLLREQSFAQVDQNVPTPAVPGAAEDRSEDEEEYELVMPKRAEVPIQEEEAVEEANTLYIETEDDALDEMERISNTLIRLRQQIKRSYLPGIPDHLKFMFEEVVQTLARIKAIMERHRYDLEEVAILLQDASNQLDETERVTERVISTCQLAEGAIQYTNRYRRQNRQVNELLTLAEQSFRQLAFAEAYQLAEDARLVIEGASPQEEETGWLLRRKKKG
ncbi:septation ring formation regulator EzrA [Brevibacillus panacihumi]|uniref:septation ring formation regulator EzrA n=1 Tax=Brevibacillus panacihumi TaxID=497735 RepID=UPI003D02DC10